MSQKFEKVKINYDAKLKKASKFKYVPDKDMIFNNYAKNK